MIDDTPMHPVNAKHHRILDGAFIRSQRFRSGELPPPALGQCDALFRVSARACCGYYYEIRHVPLTEEACARLRSSQQWTAHITKTTRRQTTWNSRFRLEFAVWVGIREFHLIAGGNRGKQLEITKQRGIHGKAVEFSQKAWNSACILEFGVFLKTPFQRPQRPPAAATPPHTPRAHAPRLGR